ncbi:MAG: N-(5'-phosphoribosyl)anthranilate isomerase [Massilioclostridium sp.]|nr:MAG: N-(5'-phosphoribosyl)anthranilate isomerase [Massilioclostridium sp.]
MTKFKLCGLRSIEDIEIANRYHPDYVGFVFAPSKRQVTKEQAKKLITQLNPAILPVGVFVNTPLEELLEISHTAELKVIQLHGEESPELVKRLKQNSSCEVWKAIRVKNEESVKGLERYQADRYLMDAYQSGAYGGSGKQFQWKLIQHLPKERLILAGGLNRKNLIEAVTTVRPYAVDLSSGAETDGHKDESKVKQLIELMKGVS